MSQVSDNLVMDDFDIDRFSTDSSNTDSFNVANHNHDSRYTDKKPLPVAIKAKFMNHVNDEHQDELAMFIEAFASTKVGDDVLVQVAEVYYEGLLLATCTHPLEKLSTDHQSNEQVKPKAINRYFIEFDDLIDETVTIKSQYIHLLQVAAKKLGKLAIKQQAREFTVFDCYYVSPNMFRLIVMAPADTPLNHAGYAYLFEMNADALQADQSIQSAQKLL